jgi:shikimate dehydrogenase
MPLLGLIGYPLSHSYSPGLFRDRLKEYGQNDSPYELFPLPSLSDFPGLLSEHKDLIGLNVTIPYKEKVIPYLHALSHEAEMIGAVNTIKISRNPLFIKGYNTDGPGFIKAYGHILIQHSKALILGSGGASKAVQWAMKSVGIPAIVISRTPSPDQLNYSELNPLIIGSHTLIINTTPLGMYPNTSGRAPLTLDYIDARHQLIDLVYNPEMTLLMRSFIERGAKTINGLPMLQEQASLSWDIWMEDVKTV